MSEVFYCRVCGARTPRVAAHGAAVCDAICGRAERSGQTRAAQIQWDTLRMSDDEAHRIAELERFYYYGENTDEPN